MTATPYSKVSVSSIELTWNALSLAKKFVLAGGAVVIIGTLIIGLWVADQIEQGVTHNSAVTTALYVDSFISPLTSELENSKSLSVGPISALDEIFKDSPVSNRLVSVKIWRLDGTIVYNNDYDQIGQKFEITDELARASAGEVVAGFTSFSHPEDEAQRQAGVPLLEIYSPIRAPWSGDIIAVSEFYEDGTELSATLAKVRLQSWVVVATVMMAMGSLLAIIVFQGSRTIDLQKVELQNRLLQVSEKSKQNKNLSQRVQKASERVSELNERFLRKTSAELHDGPAQLLGFAALRIEEVGKIRDAKKRNKELNVIRKALDSAMQEIRNISKGLSLPEINKFSIQEIIQRVVRQHIERGKSEIKLELPDEEITATSSTKICVYRFVQEALNNSEKHAGAGEITVSAKLQKDGKVLLVNVKDSGPGFDISKIDETSDRMGLVGLRERVRSIGGEMNLISSPTSGTELTMTTGLEADEEDGK